MFHRKLFAAASVLLTGLSSTGSYGAVISASFSGSLGSLATIAPPGTAYSGSLTYDTANVTLQQDGGSYTNFAVQGGTATVTIGGAIYSFNLDLLQLVPGEASFYSGTVQIPDFRLDLGGVQITDLRKIPDTLALNGASSAALFVRNPTDYYSYAYAGVGAPGGGSLMYSFQDSSSAVPEPSTWAMMLIGFGGVGFAMRRRQAGALLEPAP